MVAQPVATVERIAHLAWTTKKAVQKAAPGLARGWVELD